MTLPKTLGWLSVTTLLTTTLFSSVFLNEVAANHCGPFDFTGNCLHGGTESSAGSECQSVGPICGGPAQALPSLSLVLDANNGTGGLYLYPNSDANNSNHLWRIIGVTDGYHMVVSPRNGHALDSNGGTGNLYLSPNPDRANPNHLWRLTQLPGGYWMITSRVNGYALDANGGTGNLYLSPNPDRGNQNHLWKFANVGDFTMIGSALRN